jgi:phosphoglucomutase
MERYEPADGNLALPVERALAPIIAAANQLADIASRTGRTAPDVIT